MRVCLRREFPSTVSRILDIGAGTGLLSLMIAQKNLTAKIDAVEIDESAAIQSESNFAASPWKERLKIFRADIRDFNQLNNQPFNQYDLIITNPPFYENDFKTENKKRNIALHSDALNFEELLIVFENNLTANGKFAVLLPYHRSIYFKRLVEQKKFYLNKKILVKQTFKHNYFRSILLFSRTFALTNQSEIIIQNEHNKYTPEFVELLKDYYLHF
ncbi:MAG: tRNA1(Val) (adenine(37)-N6)-methyltransferase [Chitinophagaceae bacterium]